MYWAVVFFNLNLRLFETDIGYKPLTLVVEALKEVEE